MASKESDPELIYRRANPKRSRQEENDPITKYFKPASTLKSEFHPMVAIT
jgi:hypothetical protein